jgi:hypothetical protein
MDFELAQFVGMCSVCVALRCVLQSRFAARAVGDVSGSTTWFKLGLCWCLVHVSCDSRSAGVSGR